MEEPMKLTIWGEPVKGTRLACVPGWLANREYRPLWSYPFLPTTNDTSSAFLEPPIHWLPIVQASPKSHLVVRPHTTLDSQPLVLLPYILSSGGRGRTQGTWAPAKSQLTDSLHISSLQVLSRGTAQVWALPSWREVMI